MYTVLTSSLRTLTPFSPTSTPGICSRMSMAISPAFSLTAAAWNAMVSALMETGLAMSLTTAPSRVMFSALRFAITRFCPETILMGLVCSSYPSILKVITAFPALRFLMVKLPSAPLTAYVVSAFSLSPLLETTMTVTPAPGCRSLSSSVRYTVPVMKAIEFLLRCSSERIAWLPPPPLRYPPQFWAKVNNGDINSARTRSEFFKFIFGEL